MPDSYVERINNLTLTSITPEQKAQTCGYWYLVQKGHTSYKAFGSRPALERWLKERGLSVPDIDTMVEGQFSCHKIAGEFREACYINREAFEAIRPVLETRQMSNGEYTLGKITRDPDGIRTVQQAASSRPQNQKSCSLNQQLARLPRLQPGPSQIFPI